MTPPDTRAKGACAKRVCGPNAGAAAAAKRGAADAGVVLRWIDEGAHDALGATGGAQG